MSDRVGITLTTGTATPPTSGEKSARHIIVGQTGLGPVDGPVVVTSLADYVGKFGPRTQGSAMYDAAEFYLVNRGGPLVVMRAAGPNPVKATIGLDSNKIVVTSRNPGAAYNAWTAAYASGTKTLTLVKGSVTATYTGTTAAELETAAAIDRDVTVTVSALPSGNVSATALATGDDDYANVSWATTLALIPAGVGGSISVPGVAYGTVGSALASHAKDTQRLALLSLTNGSSSSTAASAAATVAAYTGAENAVLVWPEFKVPSGATGTKTVDPTIYAATCRAITHRQFGPGTSLILRAVGSSINTSVTPVASVNSTQFATLVAAHVSFLRALPNGVNLDNWHTTASQNPYLYGAQFRDVANVIANDAATILDKHTGESGTPVELAVVAAELEGAVSKYGRFLWPEIAEDGRQVHPGYRVSVSNGSSVSDGRISASIALRFAESAEFYDLTISSADAGSAI